MKRIELTHGSFALVDDNMFDVLSARSWHLCAKGYAVTNVPGHTRRQRTVRMHRLVIGALDEQEVDHIDGNPLNNQLDNLRLVTHQENMFNQRKRRLSSSRYKGVTWCKRSERWLAQIMKDKRNKCLGYFTDEADAARAYDDAARRLFGEFARPNFAE